jgi:hypothetical protein
MLVQLIPHSFPSACLFLLPSLQQASVQQSDAEVGGLLLAGAPYGGHGCGIKVERLSAQDGQAAEGAAGFIVGQGVVAQGQDGLQRRFGLGQAGT